MAAIVKLFSDQLEVSDLSAMMMTRCITATENCEKCATVILLTAENIKNIISDLIMGSIIEEKRLMKVT